MDELKVGLKVKVGRKLNYGCLGCALGVLVGVARAQFNCIVAVVGVKLTFLGIHG